ncbi:MAG: double-strand break repair protein AddB [Hyphomicrobiaceae bacterium]|nr:double-strand break repair protein AddB [Hyphomicrobiaceae bacterium]
MPAEGDPESAHAGLGGAEPRLYTIPPGQAFLPALAAAILAGDLPRPGGGPPQPLDLPDTTILLPTRRAARALQTAFRKASGQRALLLPKIRPIAETEEDLTLLSGLADVTDATPEASGIPPAISELERRLVLTELVLEWSDVMRKASPAAGDGLAPYGAAGASTPAQAARLARELARLIDMVETEGASLDGLARLVPEAFSEHWQLTLQFLAIVLDWWPKHLAERGLVSPMDRRNRLILAEAERLASHPPAAPVIVAGITGSIPATAELMRVVLGLENGAIVLPGLDQRLDAESWHRLGEHPEHPQHGLARLLDRLEVPRSAVRPLPGADSDLPGQLRATVLSEALRPATTTHLWGSFIAGADRDRVREALRGVALIEAPSAHDEAEAIALILREALEAPGRTAALVSPDRTLARRVASRLESWGVRVDDSAGRPFRKTVPGAFLDLVIDAASRDFEPAALMALLKHPLTRLALPAGEVRRAARALELIAFRTDYLGRGLEGIEAAIEPRARRQQNVQRLWPCDWDSARDLLARVRGAFQPLDTLCMRPGRQPLADLVRAHVTTAEALSRLPEDAAAGSPLWRGEAGEAAAVYLSGLLDPALRAPAISAADYPDFYRSLVADESVRALLPAHPRLSIWGPFEARLQRPDVVVIGALNEGTWPETADSGPWLNRPMREELGLPQPEQRLGYSAHDFTQLASARTVYLTRSQKVDGAPTVPSRWLLRLQALLDGMQLRDALEADRPWLGWARARDMAASTPGARPPSPCPAVALRPRRLSVSDVERWIANPYALFARRILELEPLPLLGSEPGPALRGAIVHEALGRFVALHPERLPDDPCRELISIASAILLEYTGNPRVAAFWVPRLERFACWFGDTEPARREGASRVLAELAGAHVLDGPAGPFTLTARADRVDVHGDGLVITDYKTGGQSQVSRLAVRAAEGSAPQLPLEAMIALEGGFEKLEAAAVKGLRYISAAGGEPPGIEAAVRCGDPAALAGETRKGLERLIAAFDRPDTPYRAVRRPAYDYRFDEYAHLARVAEWLAGETEGGGDD